MLLISETVQLDTQENIPFTLIFYNYTMHTATASQRTGVNFTNRLKLSQLSLCTIFKPQNRLKSVHEIGPWPREGLKVYFYIKVHRVKEKGHTNWV